MEQDTFFFLFWAYLRERRRIIAAFVCFIGIFLLVAALSHQALSAVLYASLLCGALGVLLLAVRYPAYVRGHHSRTALLRSASAASFSWSSEQMPLADSLPEQEWQALTARLEQSLQEQAEAYSRREAAVSGYYTLWAHQIKTPLAAIRLLLQEQDASPEIRQELFKVEQYVDMALQYLRLERAENDLVLQSHSLDALVRQAVRKTATLFIFKRIPLNLESLEANVTTDEKWLVFVLEQLLTNAVKYTPKGSVTVSMDPCRRDVLLIQDTGIGVSPEDLPRIFEWGFTGYNGRLDKHSTGIGLYLCRQALGLLGHSIKIESTPGKGTLVILNLSREKLLGE